MRTAGRPIDCQERLDLLELSQLLSSAAEFESLTIWQEDTSRRFLAVCWPAAVKIVDAGLLGQFLLKPHDLREQHCMNSAIETQNWDVVFFQPARGH